MCYTGGFAIRYKSDLAFCFDSTAKVFLFRKSILFGVVARYESFLDGKILKRP